MIEEDTRESLLSFLQRYQSAHQAQFNQPHRVEHDANWRSNCELGAADENGRVVWHPTEQTGTSFSGLEQALETSVHPAAKAYYTSVWFPGVRATSPDGDLELIGMWNQDDFENLQANIIGHALQQKRAKLPLTLFFATTLPESEYCLSLDNQTGQVLLERAGAASERVIADNLPEFLNQLQPCFSDIEEA